MNEKNILLAADSGGSKTVLRLLSDSGKILAEHRCDGLASVHSGIIPVNEILKDALGHLCRDARISPEKIATAYFSLGGPNTAEVEEVLSKLLPSSKVIVDREANGNLFSFCAPLFNCAAVVMAGTGSVAIGCHGGILSFAGGWGPNLDDAGSGYEIGRRAVAESLLALDKRSSPTSLSSIVLEFEPGAEMNSFKSRMALKAKLHGLSRRDLASLAPAVYQHALKGDKTADGIIRNAALELALLGNSVLPLNSTSQFKILALGGVFKLGDEFNRICTGELRRIRPGADFVFHNRFDLLCGSSLMALSKHGVKLDNAVFKNLGLDIKGDICK